MNQLSELLIPIFERLNKIETLISNSNKSDLMTIKDVIKYSRLSRPTIMRGIMKGGLKPFKEDGKKLFRKVDVDNWLQG